MRHCQNMFGSKPLYKDLPLKPYGSFWDGANVQLQMPAWGQSQIFTAESLRPLLVLGVLAADSRPSVASRSYNFFSSVTTKVTATKFAPGPPEKRYSSAMYGLLYIF